MISLNIFLDDVFYRRFSPVNTLCLGPTSVYVHYIAKKAVVSVSRDKSLKVTGICIGKPDSGDEWLTERAMLMAYTEFKVKNRKVRLVKIWEVLA